jgi:hypothetical protein
MKRHLPTLSKSGLLLSPCIAWANSSARWYEEDKVDKEDLDKRDQGIQFHRCIDKYISNSGKPKWPERGTEVDKWLGKAEEFVETLKEDCWPEMWSEVAISINWNTGDAIKLDCKDRDYPDNPTYMNGTADLVAILKTGELYIADWKTGTTEGCEEQLMSLACGLRKLYLDPVDGGPRRVRLETLFVNEHGVWVTTYTPSPKELDAHWDRMKERWNKKDSVNDTIPGAHCTALYCPHLAYCTAITTAVREEAMRDARLLQNL